MDIENINLENFVKKVDVVYTDVDGTFVNEGCLFWNKNGYTLKNAAAVYRLLENHVDVVMTSGREKEKLKEAARILGFRNFIANLGIEIVYNNGEKVITHFGVDVPDHKSLKKWIAKTGVIQALFQNFPGQLRYYTPWAEILRTHHLLIGELNFEEVHDWMKNQYPELRIIDNGAVPPEKDFSNPHAYHIVPARVGKKSAVQIDKRERNLKKENLIGVGDSIEDLSIADEVGIFFLLDDTIKTEKPNVVYIDNKDGEGFSKIVDLLFKNELISL